MPVLYDTAFILLQPYVGATSASMTFYVPDRDADDTYEYLSGLSVMISDYRITVQSIGSQILYCSLFFFFFFSFSPHHRSTKSGNK